MQLSKVLDEIRERVGIENLTDSCSGRGCRVDMTDVPRDRIVVDVDLAFKAHQRTGKHCDKILFYVDTTENRLVVVLIELKSGTFKVTDVAQQLQGSVNFVSSLVPRDLKATCIPVVFHGKGIHAAQRPRFRGAKVRFRNKESVIRRNKCGAPKNLANVLSGSGNR